MEKNLLDMDETDYAEKHGSFFGFPCQFTSLFTNLTELLNKQVKLPA